MAAHGGWHSRRATLSLPLARQHAYAGGILRLLLAAALAAAGVFVATARQAAAAQETE